jgi:DNA-binding GntR family transcriptional regulator
MRTPPSSKYFQLTQTRKYTQWERRCNANIDSTEKLFTAVAIDMAVSKLGTLPMNHYFIHLKV